jgi:hypothetical protein
MPRGCPQIGFPLLLLAAVALPPPANAGVLTNNCVVGERPAATLLFPYFEVDLANASGRTTLIAIANRPLFLAPVLARVTVWTDWGIPTASFTLFLPANDVQTINLRDLFDTGVVPTTGPSVDLYFAGCNSSLGGFVATPAMLLRTAHTGQNTLGRCFSSGRLGANIATGYITVDNVRRCRVGNGGGTETPVDADYFSGEAPLASTDNVLWGDWFLVVPGEAFASGNSAVHIQADPDFFGVGDYTFYGRYHGWNGADRRRPLPSRYNARFMAGGAFSGGTKLIVWRDTRDPSTASLACGTQPGWAPLGEREILAHDEAASLSDLGATAIFDLATQRMDISAVPQPYVFGFLQLNLNLTADTPAQAWVGVEASASGQFSVGFAASPANDLCAVAP